MIRRRPNWRRGSGSQKRSGRDVAAAEPPQERVAVVPFRRAAGPAADVKVRAAAEHAGQTGSEAARHVPGLAARTDCFVAQPLWQRWRRSFNKRE
jgi:hypothetical protein